MNELAYALTFAFIPATVMTAALIGVLRPKPYWARLLIWMTQFAAVLAGFLLAASITPHA